MGKHPKVFPPIFVNMVRAGETGGVLDEVLVRVADHFESELALKGKIKSAMTYPIAMGALVLMILAAMMVFVVPVFEEMFTSMGGELPFITQLLVDTSDFVSGIGGLFLLVAVSWRSSCSGGGRARKAASSSGTA
jgi:type IV pilus assembly protein PilC